MESQAAHLREGDDHTGLVAALVEFGADAETSDGAGMADQRDQRLEGAKRTPAPVLRDVAEQPVLDLVPLARAGGKCETWMQRPRSSARRCKAVFQPRVRYPLLPPPSAVM